MKKRKLNYRFHNPNPVDVTADYILKIMMQTNEAKVERALRDAAEFTYGTNLKKIVQNEKV